MRILAINGAPRLTGFTRELLDLFCEGAREAGGTPEIVDLSARNVLPCRGCYNCWRSERAGRCVQNDDLNEIAAQLLESSYLVLATPLYFYSFSALMKAFVERLFQLIKPEFERSSGRGLMRNKRRNCDLGPEGAVLIAVGGYPELRNMEGLVSTFDLICEGLSIEPRGKLLRPESFFLDFAASKPLTLRKIHAAFTNAGRELVSHGRVSAASETDAALRLTNDDTTYMERTAVYWTIADEIDANGVDRARLRERAAIDLRILVPELADCLDPAVAGDLRATILLEIDGNPQHSWHLVIADGRCQARPGIHREPDLTLTLTAQTLVYLILGRIDPRTAVSDGAITAQGALTLLARMGRLFPPPAR